MVEWGGGGTIGTGGGFRAPSSYIVKKCPGFA